MNIAKLRASVADAQRQGAPDNAMISIPIGELDQVLEEVEALEGQRNALDVRLPQGDEKQLRDALRELEAHRDELAANLRSVEAIAEVAKRDARKLAVDLEAAEWKADLWQHQCHQAREQLEAHRELAWRVVNIRTHGAGAAGAMYDLAARLHDPDWRPPWDHNGDGEISDNAELDEYTKNAEEAFGLKPQSDQWSDHEARITRLEQASGILTDDQAAELFGPEEEEQDR